MYVLVALTKNFPTLNWNIDRYFKVLSVILTANIVFPGIPVDNADRV